MSESNQINGELADFVGQFADDPLGFVKACYPWGEPGPLANHAGPDAVQSQFLTELGEMVRERGYIVGGEKVSPILMSRTSGHGTGKSAQGAWLVDWVLSTRPHSIGTVTAATQDQLESRTWAAVQQWTKLCLTAPWFNVYARGVFSKVDPENWKVVQQTCKAENAQAFAGQHAQNSTSWYLFDEASNIPDEIWPVAYGGLTASAEPMFFAWGQAAKNTGEFHNVCFGPESSKWNTKRIDSRESGWTNKKLLQEWIDDYGLDSDFVRVRVLGLPPAASELQFIDTERVRLATEREVETLSDEPLICGFDVSAGGNAWNVFRFRRGLDARTLPPIRIPGEQARDRNVLVGRAAELLREGWKGQPISMMFIDSAFGAAIYERLCLLGFGSRVEEINFGGKSPDEHQKNMRAYMWQSMKDWLAKGAIDALDKLTLGLSAPGYTMDRSNKLVLESKQDMQRDGRPSPDDADALALTFARKVGLVAPPKRRDSPRGFGRRPTRWS